MYEPLAWVDPLDPTMPEAFPNTTSDIAIVEIVRTVARQIAVPALALRRRSGPKLSGQRYMCLPVLVGQEMVGRESHRYPVVQAGQD